MRQILLTLLLLTVTLFANDARLDNYPRAQKWEKDANSNADSAYNLGNVYHETIKDYEKAIYWYKKAYSMNKSNDVINNLGLTYKRVKNYTEAIKWYKIGINQNDSDCAFNLALLYEEELKEFQNAIKHYEKAISLGNEGAAFNLGILYKNELKDYPNAIKYYTKAYEMGQIGGANGLGYFYEHTLKDTTNAELWYKKAVAKNNKKAIGNLAKLYKQQNKKELGSAYMVSLIGNGYTKQKVLTHLKTKWKLTDSELQKAYKLQLKLDIPKHYRGGIN